MKIMGLAEIMDSSFTILRKQIKSLVIYSSGFSILLFIIFIILMLALGIFIGILRFSYGYISTLFIENNVWLFIAFLLSVCFFLYFSFTLAYDVGIIKISTQDFYKIKIYAADVIKMSFKYIPKIMGIVFFYLIILVPIITAFTFIAFRLVPFIESLISTPLNSLDWILIVFFSLFTVVFIIFAFITMNIFLSFTIIVAVIEQRNIFKSIKRSYFLVKDKFWTVFSSVFLFYAGVFAINFSLRGIISLIILLVYLIMSLFNVQVDYYELFYTVYNYANWPLLLINWAIITPLTTIMITLLYFNKRYEKEAYDITLKLMDLEKRELVQES